MMDYKNAFKCEDCPETNTKHGCPAWVEYSQTNMQTGEERIKKGCLGQELIPMLTQVIMASNRPAAEIGKMRGELQGSFQQLIDVAAKVQQQKHLS